MLPTLIVDRFELFLLIHHLLLKSATNLCMFCYFGAF